MKFEVYSTIAMEVHTASDLHQKQRPDETFLESIQNFTNLNEKEWELTQLTLLSNYIFICQKLV